MSVHFLKAGSQSQWRLGPLLAVLPKTLQSAQAIQGCGNQLPGTQRVKPSLLTKGDMCVDCRGHTQKLKELLRGYVMVAMLHKQGKHVS